MGTRLWLHAPCGLVVRSPFSFTRWLYLLPRRVVKVIRFRVVFARYHLTFPLYLTLAIGGDGIPEAPAVPEGLAFHPCTLGLVRQF